MAFGSTYNNNKRDSNVPEVTIYSAYRFNNAESKIDATCLTFRFWKNNLCVGIFPRKNTGNDEVSFDMDNGITIYLSHTKARILKHELELFLSDPITYNAVGVPSGQAAITISNGSEYGKNNPVITIRKVAETGEVVASFSYEFKTDIHYAIRNYDGKNFDSAYDDYRNIEIEQFITVLDEFVKASTNAIAFSVMDQRKYSQSRVEDKINSICSSLGIEVARSQSNTRGGSYNRSFFNSNASEGGNSGYTANSVSYGSASIDDLE